MSAITTRGTVTIAVDKCKGCDLCIPACRPGVLQMTTAPQLNLLGFRYPQLLAGCTGCRACYEVCPDYVFEVFRYEEPIELDDDEPLEETL